VHVDPGLAYLSDTQASHTGPLAVMITTIAMLWNLIYNSLFEYWESRQAKRGAAWRGGWRMPSASS
jgi:uncharacterized membrane protein